jgi:hypothetical protein
LFPSLRRTAQISSPFKSSAGIISTSMSNGTEDVYSGLIFKYILKKCNLNLVEEAEILLTCLLPSVGFSALRMRKSQRSEFLLNAVILSYVSFGR